jgi:Dirigent-like protein
VTKRFGAVAVLALAAVLTVGLGAASAAPKPQTISFLEVNTSFVGIGGYNVASNGPPLVGQGFGFTSTLFKWAGVKKGSPLGHDQVVCTVLSEDLSTGSVRAQCAATNFLPGGTIQLAGSTNFANPVTNVAVVGGTGIYAGAEGTATIRNIGGENSSSSAYVIHITN